MPRKVELTWQPGAGKRAGRWRKKYNGKVYYFPFGTSKSDLDGYRQALEAWKAKKAMIDAEEAGRPRPHQADFEHAIEEWTTALSWASEHGDQRSAAQARSMLDDLRQRLSAASPPPLRHSDRLLTRFEPSPEDLAAIAAAVPGLRRTLGEQRGGLIMPDPESAEMLDGSPQRIRREIWKDRLDVQRRKTGETHDTVEAAVGAFLAAKRVEVQAGKLSAGRFDPLRGHLYHFRDWVGGAVSVRSLTGRILAGYHSELLGAVAGGRYSCDYAGDRMNATKTFVRWLWSTEAIESLPRILGDKRALRIGKRVSVPQTFTVEEVKTLLEKATDRTKLFVLLMLNTGMTQKDLSDLRQSEVDWEQGLIIRKRSKTSGHKGVPTVSYRLWGETLRLLRQERSADPERVFVNELGHPLKTESIDAGGRLRKIDNVASAFARLRRKTGVAKPIKSLRKTAATMIRGEKQYSGVESLFLGHAPRSISDRHYAAVPQALLDEAVAWLGRQFGVE